MAVVAFERFRFLWGAVDWQSGSGNPYSAAATASLGPSAAPGAGNIGVRRTTLVFDRSTVTPGDDDMTMHFDFLNMTGGNPDDTWTTGDYTTLEALLLTLWTALKAYSDNKVGLREIRWHRHGAGITPPNPAERTLVLGSTVFGTVAGATQAPQVACSITFRTAVRRSWGRTYLPISGLTLASNGRISPANMGTINAAVQTMVNGAAAADFRLVVPSIALSAALNVEKTEVDDIPDVVRRRRWKHTYQRSILP